jgi:glycosyltransferase involved in cell wall biosynthesis
LSADPVRRRLCDWAIRRAARVIAVADNLAERALAGGVSPARLEIIANGVDADRFRPIDRDAARRALGIEQSGPLVLSVGHLSPRKGFQRVIAALPCILCAYPDAIVAIVGGPGAEGNNGSELRRKAADLGVAHRVIFVGPVPPERVALWLGAADVLALASAFEGCPNVVLEAMACGRPVVATRVGHVDAMVPSFAGVLFGASESDDALAQALLAALARSWDAQRIRDHASALSWESVAQRVAAQWRLAVSEAASCGTAAPSAVDAAGRRARKIALPFSASGIIKR